jgi:hypothetical protein
MRMRRPSEGAFASYARFNLSMACSIQSSSASPDSSLLRYSGHSEAGLVALFIVHNILHLGRHRWCRGGQPRSSPRRVRTHARLVAWLFAYERVLIPASPSMIAGENAAARAQSPRIWRVT